MTKNIELKIAVIKSGKTQKVIANEVGIHPSLLSMAISGRYNLSESEKSALAETLDCKVAEIFKN